MASLVTLLQRDQRATAAVEFAFVAPVLLMLLFGIVAYGHAFGVYHGVQQIAAEAARASVAGLDDAERERLARAFVTRHASTYAFLDPGKLTVRTATTGAPAPSFEVAIAYDFSDSVFNRLGSLISLPLPVVERRAVVQRGGY